MIKAKIVEFREQRGAGHPEWSRLEDDHCFLHCLHMSREGSLSHSPDWALRGKGEAVGMRSFTNSTVDTVASILWDQFEHSPIHRRIVLMPNIACGVYVYGYNVYLTIRGW